MPAACDGGRGPAASACSFPSPLSQSRSSLWIIYFLSTIIGSGIWGGQIHTLAIATDNKKPHPDRTERSAHYSEILILELVMTWIIFLWGKSKCIFSCR